MPAARDLRGRRYGRLVALEPCSGSRSYARRWRCRCDCGGVAFIHTAKLVNGETRSCGCLRRENSRKLASGLDHALYATKHGLSHHPVYVAWCNMRKRCEDPSNPGYRNYGARGISICDRWQNVELFFGDLIGFWPGRDYEMHRIDRDGDYEPLNVEWVERSDHRRIHARKRRGPDGRFQ